jgi:predicted MFS family arabinose efflux permease
MEGPMTAEIATGNEKPSLTRTVSSLETLIFLVLLCLAYSINAADRQIFPTLLPTIRQEFGYDIKVAGLLATFFTLGLAVAGLPAGHIVDRASRKTIILIAMVIYSVFTVATVFAQGFWDMLIYRVMTGVGEGMQMAALFAAVGSYFHRRRSFFIGWLIVAYGVGAYFGPRIGAMLAASADSWRTPFVWFAVAGVVIAAIVLVFVPREFTESAGPEREAATDQTFAQMPDTAWNRNVLLGVVGCIILGYSLYGFIGLYTTYLREVHAFSQIDAAAAFSYFGLGGLLSFAGGWLGDRFSQRWVTALAFALLAAVSFAMYNWATSLSSQSILSFLIGALGSGVAFVNLLSLLQRSVPPRSVGAASGIFLTAVFGAGSTAGFLLGALVGQFGWGGAALIELTLFPIVGIIAMALVNPAQLIAVRKS